MRLIRNNRLSDAIAANHSEATSSEERFSLRDLVRCVIDVCQTIEYAHCQGVIHRDIKPHNVLIGDFGETIVVDWGAAKRISETDVEVETKAPSSNDDESPFATEAGKAIGTPAYMSPEQARGSADDVGKKSDVFCIGATLYEVLSGKPPFHAESTLQSHALAGLCEVAPPRRRNASIPRALEAICLRALARAPENRFDSPAELAKELSDWLADEPVSSYQENVTERLFRSLRRHRRFAMNAAIATAIVMVVLAVSVIYLRIANYHFQRGLYLSLCRLGQAAIQRADGGTLQELFQAGFPAIDPGLRSWEYGYLDMMRQSELRTYETDHGLQFADFSSDSRHLATCSNEGRLTVRRAEDGALVWEAPQMTSRVSGLACAGDLVAWSSYDPQKRGSNVYVRDFRSHVEQLHVQTANEVSAIELSPSGNLLAVAEVTSNGKSIMKLIDLMSSQEVASYTEDIRRIRAISFSDDGEFVAYGGALQPDTSQRGRWGVRKIDAASHELSRKPTQYEVTRIAWAPNQGELFVGQQWGLSQRWPINDGKVGEIPWTSWEHNTDVRSAAYSKNSKATTTSEESVFWRASGGDDRSIVMDGPLPYRKIAGHWSQVIAIAFSANQEELYSVGSSGTVRVWSTRRAHNAAALYRYDSVEKHYATAFSGDGQLIVAGGRDDAGAVISLWNRSYRHQKTISVPGDVVQCVDFVDDTTAFSVTESGRMSLVDLERDEVIPIDEQLHAHRVLHAASCQDGRIVLGNARGELASLRPSTNAMRRIDTFDSPVTAVAVCPVTKRVACGSGNTVSVYDSRGKLQRRHQIRVAPVRCCTFSVDGSLLAVSTGGFDGSSAPGDVVVWNSNGNEVMKLVGEKHIHSGVNRIVFSKDSKRLFLTSLEHMLQIVRVDDGEPLFDIHGYFTPTIDLSISPDGLTVGVSLLDGTTRFHSASAWK